MLQNKKIVCLIPARGGSKGIKFKNLRKIKKKSLLQASIDFAKNLNFIDAIVVSSENKKIINIAKNNNCEVHLRSKYLSRDFASDTEIINSVLANKNYKKYDYILYLQPTSPIRYEKHFIDSLKQLIKKKADSIWSVTKISNKYHPLKILKKYNFVYFQTFVKEGQKVVARQQLSDIFIRNGIFYFFSIRKFLRNKSIYLPKSLYYEINYEYVNIDTKEDLLECKKLSKKLNLDL